MRTFIGGIGSDDFDRASLGMLVSERLASDAPINAAGVVVAGLNGDPLALADRLNGEWPQFERVIFVGAVARARPAGTVTAYKWDRRVPNDYARDRDEDRHGDLEGAGALFDNTVLTVSRVADLPGEIIMVEIEPDSQSSRGELGPVQTRAVERARTLVRRLATSAHAATKLPECALGEFPAQLQRADYPVSSSRQSVPLDTLYLNKNY